MTSDEKMIYDTECSNDKTCNIWFLREGTRLLIDDVRNNPYDYYHIECFCSNFEEYFGRNFINCSNCKKFYCLECNRDLVYKIHFYESCECEFSNQRYIECNNHYYCTLCEAIGCSECLKNEEEQSTDGGPFSKCSVCCPLFPDEENNLLCDFHLAIK